MIDITIPHSFNENQVYYIYNSQHNVIDEVKLVYCEDIEFTNALVTVLEFESTILRDSNNRTVTYQFPNEELPLPRLTYDCN